MTTYPISLFLALAYGALLSGYRWGWRALPEWHIPNGFVPKSRISILIPARNEADTIGACLRSILEGSYPLALLEVIVLDDFSDDGTEQKVNQLLESSVPKKSGSESLVRCLQLSDYFPPETRHTPNKKKALALGVAQAFGEIIVTTDADCMVPKDWLLNIAAAFENPQTQMVCAPVNFHREQNILQRFQSLDFLGLMGITGAGIELGRHYMANGANLAYRKQAFESVEGYVDNEHHASGDDLFLAQKMAVRWPGGVIFLKNSSVTVFTEAPADIRAFWHQRLRWGTKNAILPDWSLRLSLLTVFLFCWSIWVNLGLAIGDTVIGGPAIYFWVFLFQMGIKAFFDYLFLSEMTRFFKREDLMRSFLSSFILHTAYIPIIGMASLFIKKYTWKGRRAN